MHPSWVPTMAFGQSGLENGADQGLLFYGIQRVGVHGMPASNVIRMVSSVLIK